MKKIFNILLFTIVLTISSFIFSTVKAEKIKFYYECTYGNPVAYHSETNLRLNSTPETFYYTDMKTDIDTKLGVLQKEYQGSYLVEISTSNLGISNIDYDNSDSFISALQKFNSCPKYAEIIYSKNKDANTKLYSIKYTNELTICSAENDDCGGFYTLTDSKTYDVETDDIMWIYDHSYNSHENGFYAKFYIKDRHLYVTYKDNTSDKVSMQIPVFSATWQDFGEGYGGIYVYSISRIKGLASTINNTTLDSAIYCSVKLSHGSNGGFEWKTKNKNGWTDFLFPDAATNLCNSKDLTELTKEIENKLGQVNVAVSVASSKNGLIEYDSETLTGKSKDFSSYTCEQLAEKVKFYNTSMNGWKGEDIDGKRFAYEILLNELADLEIKLSNYNGCATTKQQYMDKLNNAIERLRVIMDASSDAIKNIKDIDYAKDCNNDFQRADKATNASDEAIAKAYARLAMIVKKFSITSGCDILSRDLKKFLNTILWYVKIAAIVLAMILSLLDYVKAAAGTDDKPMTAANKRFITRLLLIIILFLLPVILTFILNLLNVGSATGDSIECLINVKK